MGAHLLQFVVNWPHLAYGLIFAGMFFEGDLILFTVLYLAHQGILNYSIVIPVVFIGVTSGDIGWYWIGRLLEKRSPRLTRWLFFIIRPLDPIFLNHPLKIIVLSKFTYGFNHATLMRSGSLKLPFKSFFKAELVASTFWMLVLGGLGYALSASFPLIRHSVHAAETGLLIGLLAMLLVVHFVSWTSKMIINREVQLAKKTKQ